MTSLDLNRRKIAGKKTQATRNSQKSILFHPMLWYETSLATAGLFSSGSTRLPDLWNAVDAQLELVSATPPQAPLFGFAEYLAALALLFVVLTTSDFRYRFRMSVTRIHCTKAAFFISFSIGFLILLIDTWFHNGLPIPRVFENSNNLKLALASCFLFLTCYLSYVAFIYPPKFGRWNARESFDAIHYYVARGNADQLAVIADWLGDSAEQIVKFAAARSTDGESRGGALPLSYVDYAYYTLLLMGDKKLCRQMVENSPWTIAEFFRAAAQQPFTNLQMSQFARNIGTELVLNSKSALYVEDDGYTSGFLGFTKPITSSVFGNSQLLEEFASSGGSPLDIDINVSFDLAPSQLAAYARAVMIFTRSYVSQQHPHHSFAFTRSLKVFEHSCLSVSDLEGKGDQFWRSEEFKNLRITISFIRDLVDLLSKHPTPPKRRQQIYRLDGLSLVHAQVAELIFEIIRVASRLKGPSDLCWTVQHNAIWGDLFDYSDTGSSKLIAYYLRRLMYDEIKKMDDYTNFVGAGIIGYCLNVMGVSEEESMKSDRLRFEPLRRAAVIWVKHNYLKLVREYPVVAEAILIGGLSFNPESKQLVKTYASMLGKPSAKRYLQLVD